MKYVPFIGPSNWGPLLAGRLRRVGSIEGEEWPRQKVTEEEIRKYAEFMEARNERK